MVYILSLDFFQNIKDIVSCNVKYKYQRGYIYTYKSKKMWYDWQQENSPRPNHVT